MPPAIPNPAPSPLAVELDRRTTLAAPALAFTEPDSRIRCVACGHRCLIGAGKRGICKVRFNDAGQLRVPFGYVAALQCDPVEKKPFFHVLPGADALTFGMMGCDYHCSYCQNWVTSQALRDPTALAPIRLTTPEQLVALARQQNAGLVVSSYNEPLITAEWAAAVFSHARPAGLLCAFVSNGNATSEALDFIRPWISAYKVDLKAFNQKAYASLGGVLSHVTDTIRMVHQRSIWLEVVTLLIPGFNDDPAELKDLTQFIASVSRDIPWHVTAFHKDYKMTDPANTTPADLLRAVDIADAAGLRFIYPGNLPNRVGPWENTRCPACKATLIERTGYLVRSYRITPANTCPDCQTKIPGVWPAAGPAAVRCSPDADYHARMPRVVR